jgi:bacteriophage HK97-gp10 putative tail-component
VPFTSRVVENQAAMRQLLSGPDGAIARDLARRAINVRNRAVYYASGNSAPGARNPAGRGPRVDTGRLRSSIAWEIRREPGGSLSARIGTNVDYGYFLETGLRNGATYPFLRPALPAARE